MPGAIIAFDQDRPSGSSAGTPGVARRDLWIGRVVRPRVTTSGNSTYKWVLLDKPPGSSAAITSDTSQVCAFTPDLVGSYRVQVTVNGGGPGNVQILIAACTYDTSGTATFRSWRIPALGESSGENNFGGNVRSWDDDLRFLLTDINDSLGGDSATLIGDVTGSIGANSVVKIRGYAITEDVPDTGNVLIFNGTSYAPGTVTSFIAGGDLSGTATNQTVAKVHGATVPEAGSLVTGNAAYVSGTSALNYSALALDGGSGWVSGVLPAANRAAATFTEVQTALAAATGNVAFNSHRLTGLLDPSTDTDADTQGARNAAIASALAGITSRAEVALISTTNITLSGEQTIDGVLTSASRVLVNGQTTGSQNGIYVTSSGSWARASDMPAGSNASGTLVIVDKGTAKADTLWLCTSNSGSALVGTDSLNWIILPHPSVSGTTPSVLSTTGSAGTATIVSASDHVHAAPKFVENFSVVSSIRSTSIAYPGGEVAGSFSFDMGNYPLISGYSRTVTLEGSIQSSAAGVTTTVQLVDVDASLVAVGASADNSGALDASLPTAFSITLTVGFSSGTLRSDIIHRYYLLYGRANGSSGDRASITNARIVVRYV